MTVNKEGADWLNLKSELNSRIERLQDQMLRQLTEQEYNFTRGNIVALREVIEFVEPTTPPKTTEEHYDISTPDQENYP